MSSLPVIYLAAAPLRTAAPVRIRGEWTALLDALGESGRAIRLEGVNPAALSRLPAQRASDARPVLQIAAHGSGEGLELERGDGSAQFVTADVLGSAVAALDPQVVLLNGCDTEPLIGPMARAGVRGALIACDGFLDDAVAVAYTDVFHRHLLAAGDIDASHRQAIAHVRQICGAGTYHLAAPGRLSGLAYGTLSVNRSFTDVLRRATATERLIGRDDEIAAARESIDSARHVTWVAGPRLAGVSSVLRAIADRYSWRFDGDPVLVDLRTLECPGAVVQAVADQLSPTDSAGLQATLERSNALLVLDHFDALSDDDAGALWAQLDRLDPACRSHVVIGSFAGVAMIDARQRLTLGELTADDAAALLARELPHDPQARLRRLSDALPRWPGRLRLAADALRNGATLQDVVARARDGDQHSGYESVVRRLTADEDNATVLAALIALRGVAARSVAVAATRAIWRVRSGDECADERFERALTALRDADAVRLQFSTSDDDRGRAPEVVLRLDGDVGAVARRQLAELLPTPRRALVAAACDCIRERLASDELRPVSDAGWLLAVFEQLRDARAHADILALGRALLDVDGVMRRRGAPRDVERLADIALEAARNRRDDDLVGYYVLLVGEGQYKRGEIDNARQTFERGLGFEIGPQRSLQLLRALGQTAYRRGDYACARDYYEQASRYRAHADDRATATLDHQLAKALFRLGETERALELLETEVETRRRLGDRFNELKARHELARVQLKAGRADLAERGFEILLVLARGSQFTRFISPPAYELCKLRLAAADIDGAAALQTECYGVAVALNDSMWKAFGQLAAGFVSIQRGDVPDGLAEIRDACEVGRRLGYAQLVADAHRWLLDHVGDRLLGAGSEEAIALLAATPSGARLSPDKLGKALGYATAPERIEHMTVRLRSRSALRALERTADGWACDCALFAQVGSCSHVIAIELLTRL